MSEIDMRWATAIGSVALGGLNWCVIHFFPVFPEWIYFSIAGISLVLLVIAAFFALRGLSLFSMPSIKRSPLEINYNYENPGYRFASMESPIFNARGDVLYPSHWEHRVEIVNRSMKTVRNVTVTREIHGLISTLPELLEFDATKSSKIDIHPGANHFVTINRHPLKPMAGMPAHASAWQIIRIVVSGEDMVSSVKIFWFNYDTKQKIFDTKPPILMADMEDW